MAGGRPARYKLENTEIARRCCMPGATNASLAERFEVCRRTIDNWIARIPEFSATIRRCLAFLSAARQAPRPNPSPLIFLSPARGRGQVRGNRCA